jgi:hypothetical protein
MIRTRHWRSDTRPLRSDPQCSRLRLAPVGTGQRGNSSAPRVSLLSHPITGIAACCARAAIGQVAAAPPSSVMNSVAVMRKMIITLNAMLRNETPWVDRSSGRHSVLTAR